MNYCVKYIDLNNKDEENINMVLLSKFLSHYFVDNYYGCLCNLIYLTLYNKPKKNRIYNTKLYYNTIPYSEFECSFDSNNTLSLDQFLFGFEKAKEAISKIAILQVKGESLNFQYTKLQRDFDLIHTPSNIEELKEIQRDLNNSNFDDNLRIRYINTEMKSRRDDPIPHNKKIQEVRIYENMANHSVDRWCRFYSVILTTLLNNAAISSPQYTHIYISLGNTLDEAKLSGRAEENFYTYTYAALDLEAFEKKGKIEKGVMFYQSLKQALNLIADFDRLDTNKLNNIFDYIESQDINNFELTFLEEIKKKYTASIVFKLPILKSTAIVYRLRLVDNKTEQQGEIEIGSIKSAAYYCFRKIVIKDNNVEIRAREGFSAKLYRSLDGERSDKCIFKISDIFEEK